MLGTLPHPGSLVLNKRNRFLQNWIRKRHTQKISYVGKHFKALTMRLWDRKEWWGGWLLLPGWSKPLWKENIELRLKGKSAMPPSAERTRQVQRIWGWDRNRKKVFGLAMENRVRWEEMYLKRQAGPDYALAVHNQVLAFYSVRMG